MKIESGGGTCGGGGGEVSSQKGEASQSGQRCEVARQCSNLDKSVRVVCGDSWDPTIV